jgi:hypothetical protein
MCLDCAVQYGKLRFERKGDCPVCFESKDLVEVVCGKHTRCLLEAVGRVYNPAYTMPNLPPTNLEIKVKSVAALCMSPIWHAKDAESAYVNAHVHVKQSFVAVAIDIIVHQSLVYVIYRKASAEWSARIRVNSFSVPTSPSVDKNVPNGFLI